VETEVREAGPYERLLTVTFDAAELETAKDRAARKLSRQMKIKGFRPGKAPRAIVERMVGAESLQNEAIEDALPELVGRAMEQAELKPATNPRVEEIRDGDGGGVDVDVKITLWPTVDAVPDFADRKITVDVEEVTDAEVEEQIDRLRSQFAELEDVSRAAIDGDFAMVNISAEDGGRQVEEASADDLLYEVGSHSFITGLDDLVAGASAGDIREGPATLPPGFGQDEARDVHLRVLIKGVKAKKLPEVTDEWAADVSEFDTVAELEERLRINLRSLKLSAASNSFRTQLIDDLGEELGVDLPDALIEAEMEAALHNLIHDLEPRGIDFADYLRITGQSQDDFLADVRQRAIRSLRTRILLEAVASIEGIEVSDDDVEEALASLATSAGRERDDIEKVLRDSGQDEVLASDILRRKALDRIVSGAIPVDGDGNPVDLTPPAAEEDEAAGQDEDDDDGGPEPEATAE
jgi:trigger factor